MEPIEAVVSRGASAEEAELEVAELVGLVVNDPVDELVAEPVCVVPLFAEEPGADVTVFFEFFEATAPPIPPPTAATMTIPTTTQTIKNIFFVKPQYFLGGGGRGVSCFSSFGGIALEYRIICRIRPWSYNPFIDTVICQGMVLYVSMV
jgi:hypothetical protein